MTKSVERFFLGVDVGSISTNLAVIDDSKELIESVYIRTEGKPVKSVQKGIKIMKEKIGYDLEISGREKSIDLARKSLERLKQAFKDLENFLSQ